VVVRRSRRVKQRRIVLEVNGMLKTSSDTESHISVHPERTGIVTESTEYIINP
jgi:hypothetical protein